MGEADAREGAWVCRDAGEGAFEGGVTVSEWANSFLGINSVLNDIYE